MRFSCRAQRASARLFACGLAVYVGIGAFSVFLANAQPTAISKPDKASANDPQQRRHSRRLPRRPVLTWADQVATLEAVHIALNTTADGATYVWRRHHGNLDAIIQPTQSFKDGKDGRQRVCRHVVIMLISGSFTRRAEGIACRLIDGSWALDG